MKLSDIVIACIWGVTVGHSGISWWLFAVPFGIYFGYRFISGFIDGWGYARKRDANSSKKTLH